MARTIKGNFYEETGRYRAGVRQVRDYLKRDMARIEGYLTPRDAMYMAFVDDVQRANDIGGDLLDIGVWRGRVTFLLANMARSNEKVFAVDLFDLREPTHKQYNDPAVFQNNLSELKLVDKVQIIKAHTVADRSTILSAIGDSRPRFVYIDGGHDYATCRNDVALALDMVSSQGVVVCNDYLSPTHPAVTEAVVEEVKSRGDAFCAFMIDSKRLWLCPSNMYKLYYSETTSMFSNVTRSPQIFGRRARLVMRDKKAARDNAVMD
ncbi:class I SAM-dependent methyltransferase [Reyranella sp.]|jgi:hypothetical protein|uniref:class I SAM-dependent methyltransferase n=1 Tax=Reyranella sp. TaxID=1929291 RepID=UPI003D098E93